tara:strand:+ start:305 stop:688 length:384 start_codon:yes stop_codon:yes gene_type:complete
MENKLFTKTYIQSNIKEAVDNKASIIFWHQAMGRTTYLIKEDNQLWKEEMKRMRKDFKNGILEMIPGNNKTFQNQGTWHQMVVQTTDPDKCPNQPLSTLGFGYLVSGLPYYFKNKRDRDQAYNYLTK